MYTSRRTTIIYAEGRLRYSLGDATPPTSHDAGMVAAAPQQRAAKSDAWLLLQQLVTRQGRPVNDERKRLCHAALHTREIEIRAFDAARKSYDDIHRQAEISFTMSRAFGSCTLCRRSRPPLDMLYTVLPLAYKAKSAG